jgi:predicted ATP-grasp superfamily ATP-dependent carboligase
LSTKPVLIAALSGRALAASARRAGYTPFVVDGFGDVDTLRLSGSVEVISNAIRKGFEEGQLLAALERLCGQISGGSPELVLGAGFEDRPALIERLAKTYTVRGCPASSIQACKDPGSFFEMLRELGIVCPETELHRPEQPEGWISKRIGACGGRHIRRLRKPGISRKRRYYQRELKGVSLSATAIASANGTAFAFTQSWHQPYQGEPFRYGGTVSVDHVDEDLEARIIDTCLSLIEPLGLVGLVSFDFLIDDSGEAFLIEVNPRPGASLDVLDDDSGTLFAAHLAACRGEDSIELLAKSWRPSPSASAYLYADEAELKIENCDWPEWVSDQPHAQQEIGLGEPIVTVHAGGEHAQDAARICHERLAQIKAVLYDKKTN